MIRPQTDTSALDVLLHDKSVGTLIQHADRRLRFMFNERYTADARPAVLSLSFKAADGSLLPGSRSSRGRAPAFFANLLPEGSLRTYIAKQSKISTHDEFMLLWLLGADLPGAVKLQADNDRELEELLATRPASAGTTNTNAGARLRFSLAGVQMKFSAQLQDSERFTLPATGRGGSWIVKLPAPQYPHLVENEFAMMQLAGTVGIQVPETRIVATGYIDGLPAGPWQDQQLALAIRRFDRADGGRRIHIEDFAQIFGVFPERKYEGVSCRNICAVINNEARQQDSEEFIRRLVFCAMIGNGDMHLKNWSLIYPDGKNPQLAPAYDLVSTIVYIRQDTMALSVAGSKSFEDFNPQLLLRLAAAAGLAQAAVKNVAAATVEATASNWPAIAAQSSLPAGDRKIIGQHISRIASKFTSWL